MKRPAALKPKRKSALRLSFGPGGATNADDGEANTSEVFTPKKSNLSRRAIEKNALRKSIGQPLPLERLPIHTGDSEDRPSYSTDYLTELRNSTPSTPRDLKSLSDAEDADVQLDLASKFPIQHTIPTSSIPTEAEIREKKERRARLAQEQEFIGLGNSDHDENEISLRPRPKYAETRLAPDDEDVAEGFDALVSDGNLSLGKKAEKEAKRRKRLEMEELIQEAEGGSSSEEDADSDEEEEAERKAAYDLAQTRAGTYGSALPLREEGPEQMRIPSKITPLPTLKGVLERLQGVLQGLEEEKGKRTKRIKELRKEKVEIITREAEVQRLLKEMGDRYETLRVEAGIGADTAASANGDTAATHRGLETFGHSPLAAMEEQ